MQRASSLTFEQRARLLKNRMDNYGTIMLPRQKEKFIKDCHDLLEEMENNPYEEGIDEATNILAEYI